jgi:hypothetical protein
MRTKIQSQIIHPKKVIQNLPFSLDLNPIKNLWKILKDAVQHDSIYPKNTSDLRVVIAREWKIISGQKLLFLCHSIPTRLQAVIEASGGHTRW